MVKIMFFYALFTEVNCIRSELNYFSAGSRPLNKAGDGLQKTFSALRASVWSKNKRGPLAWIRHCTLYTKNGAVLLKSF